VIERLLREHNSPYTLGRVWSTDAVFSETSPRAQRRREEGCTVVDMEASALFAVGQFRGVPVGCMLVGSDAIIGDVWDPRTDHEPVTGLERLFWLAC
jgi:uridine phosphorylase